MTGFMYARLPSSSYTYIYRSKRHSRVVSICIHSARDSSSPSIVLVPGERKLTIREGRRFRRRQVHLQAVSRTGYAINVFCSRVPEGRASESDVTTTDTRQQLAESRPEGWRRRRVTRARGNRPRASSPCPVHAHGPLSISSFWHS